MPFLPLKVEPGAYRIGTQRQSAGWWYDTHLVRWIRNVLRPVGGWARREEGGAAATAVVGAARAIFAWADNLGNAYAAVGTNSELYATASDGRRYDITPAGFAAGRDSAGFNSGYGGGFYGRGPFGAPRSAASWGDALPASVWSLDAFGEDLVACMAGDGKLYRWRREPVEAAAAIEGAPVDCQGLVVTQEGFLTAYGANRVGRRVKWADQRSVDFAISATSQAGEQDLQTRGRLQTAKALKGVTLLFTDVDVWAMRYLGYPLVYGFERLEDNCGVVSKGCVAAAGQRAVWMGTKRFWAFDGLSVQPCPCDIEDFIFGDINVEQITKVTAFVNLDHAEAWWFYPSAASAENDRYCFLNYETGRWGFGALARTCAVGKGVFAYPLMVGEDGFIYEHEKGFSYPGATPALPYAETGPVLSPFADRMMEVQGILMDEETVGEVDVAFVTQAYPNGEETHLGPYPVNSQGEPTNLLFQARQVRVRFSGAAPTDWRVGEPQLEIVQGDGA